MRDHLEIVDNLDYRHIRLSGVWNEQHAHQMIDDDASVFLQSPHQEVFVDCREQELEPSMTTEHDLASYIRVSLPRNRIGSLPWHEKAISRSWIASRR